MKSLLSSMKRKYGPLPLWAWTALASVGGVLYLRRRKPDVSETDTSGSDTLQEPVSVAGPSSDYGDVGATAPANATEEPGVFPFPDRKLSDAIGGLRDDVYGAIDMVRQTDDEVKNHATDTAEAVAPDTTKKTTTDKKPRIPDKFFRRHRQSKPKKVKPTPHAPGSRPPTRRGGHTAPPSHGAGGAGARRRRRPTGRSEKPARPRHTPTHATHKPPAKPIPRRRLPYRGRH